MLFGIQARSPAGAGFPGGTASGTHSAPPAQLLNGAISFHEASSADDAVSALRASLKSSAVVKRDGAWREAPAGDLVLGDLVKLVAGCTAPADCVLNGGHCEVDQSALTGESLPVPLDRGGEVMMSSTVVRGEAEATVVRTGASTFLGKTAGMISGTMSRPRFHAVLLRIMSALITVSAVVCFTVLGFLLDNERLTFEEAISIFVILLVVRREATDPTPLPYPPARP